MALRYDLPRVQPVEKPSLWNRTTADHAFTGGIIGSIAGLFIVGSAPILKFAEAVLEVVGMTVGAKIGGQRGMARQQREQMEGKVVRDPTWLNQGAGSGAVIGMGIGSMATAVSALLGLIGFGFPVFGIGLGCSLVGAIIGGVHHYRVMTQEFNTAVAARNAQLAEAHQQQVAQTFGLGQTQYMNSVSPQEAQALADKQRANETSHAQTLLDAQQLAQQPQR